MADNENNTLPNEQGTDNNSSNQSAIPKTWAQKNGRTAFRLKNIIRVMSIILASVIAMLLIVYGATVIATFEQSFPVTIAEGGRGGLSLSLAMKNSEPTSHLKMPVTAQIGDFSYKNIPSTIDSDEGGSKNGEDYIAFTFYLRNNINEESTISEKISILSSSKNAHSALRVRVYRDGVYETYAEIGANGLPEYGTVPFMDSDTVYIGRDVLASGQVKRYTVVIWIEGDDLECVNGIGGGSIRLGFEFSSVGK